MTLLTAAYAEMQPAFTAKIVAPNAANIWTEAIKIIKNTLPKPWVFTNGVFDVLHRGHVTYLDAARALAGAGGSLVVALNTDASARRLGKGPDRPLNRLEDRMAVIAALASVSAVLAFDQDTPYELIDALRPEVVVKGGDYDMEALPEGKLVKSYGGQALALQFVNGYSTTRLVERIRAA